MVTQYHVYNLTTTHEKGQCTSKQYWTLDEHTVLTISRADFCTALCTYRHTSSRIRLSDGVLQKSSFQFHHRRQGQAKNVKSIEFRQEFFGLTFMHLANEPKPTLNVATGCTVAVILPQKITLFCFKIPLLLSKDTGWLEMEKDKDTAFTRSWCSIALGCRANRSKPVTFWSRREHTHLPDVRVTQDTYRHANVHKSLWRIWKMSTFESGMNREQVDEKNETNLSSSCSSTLIIYVLLATYGVLWLLYMRQWSTCLISVSFSLLSTVSTANGNIRQ